MDLEAAVGQSRVSGSGQKLPPARVQGARAGTASWLEAGLAEAGAAFLRSQGQKGHLVRPVLAGTGPAVPLQPLPPCPTRSSLCLPCAGPSPCQTCLPPTLHPLQRGCTALHSGGFQGMMCTTQGVQLARRGVGGVPVLREHGWEQSAACPAPAQHAYPRFFAANVRKFRPARLWHLLSYSHWELEKHAAGTAHSTRMPLEHSSKPAAVCGDTHLSLPLLRQPRQAKHHCWRLDCAASLISGMK